MCEEYNGWHNWETWNFYNWLTSDEGYQGLVDDLGVDGTIEFLKEELENSIDEAFPSGAGFLVDICRQGIQSIDWREIKEALTEG